MSKDMDNLNLTRQRRANAKAKVTKTIASVATLARIERKLESERKRNLAAPQRTNHIDLSDWRRR